jgi:hypothetical protein
MKSNYAMRHYAQHFVYITLHNTYLSIFFTLFTFRVTFFSILVHINPSYCFNKIIHNIVHKINDIVEIFFFIEQITFVTRYKRTT